MSGQPYYILFWALANPGTGFILKWVQIQGLFLQFQQLGQKRSKAAFFGALFEEPPTYEELILGTPKLERCIALNEIFKQNQSQMVSHLSHGWNPFFESILRVYHKLVDLELRSPGS